MVEVGRLIAVDTGVELREWLVEERNRIRYQKISKSDTVKEASELELDAVGERINIFTDEDAIARGRREQVWNYQESSLYYRAMHATVYAVLSWFRISTKRGMISTLVSNGLSVQQRLMVVRKISRR